MSGIEDDFSGRGVCMRKNWMISDDGSRDLVDNILPQCEGRRSGCFQE